MDNRERSRLWIALMAGSVRPGWKASAQDHSHTLSSPDGAWVRTVDEDGKLGTWQSAPKPGDS